MQPLPFWLAALGAALAPLLAIAAEPRPAALTKAQQTTLRENVVPAHREGDPAAVLAALSPLVARMSEPHQKAADALLEEEGLPPLTELLIGNRLALIEQNRAKGLPQPQARELLLTLQGLRDKIEALLAERKSHAAFTDDMPASFADYEQRLWDMHVLANRLENAARLVRYGEQLLAGTKKLNAKSLTDADRELTATDFPALYGKLGDMNRELAERTVETRVQRVAYADEVLTDSKDLKERFQAAFWLELDGEELAKFFERLQVPLTRNDDPGETKGAEARRDKNEREADDGAEELLAPRVVVVKYRQSLADPELPAKVRQHVTHGLQAAGKDFVEKSRLLFTGLHWWFRGRYGMGTDGNGLLKSKLALTSPTAQFALYMPKETPHPTDPGQGGQQVPQIDRRHHYVWQFETRSIKTSFSSSSQTDRRSNNQVKQITTFDQFY